MKIALYIPCFNSEKTIKACLDGIFNQIHIPDEILVIDDGSTDKTIEIAKKYSVKIIRHTENKGLAAARNTAIKNTDAEFIAAIDSDCKPDKDWLKNLVNDVHALDTAGVGGKVKEPDNSNIFNIWRSIHMKQHWGSSKKNNPPFLFGSNSLLRKDALKKAGFYDEDYKSNFEDVDISTRLRKAGYNIIYEPKAVVTHLKTDSIRSLLNTFWKWNLSFYTGEGFYKNSERLAFKIRDNIGLANRFLEEDLKSARYKLVYLDFLLALHHSLRDFDYFSFQGEKDKFDLSGPSGISLWLSLLDLTFFYHFAGSKKKLSSFVKKEDRFQQNFFALNLISSAFINGRFRSKEFGRQLYRHLFLSVYKIEDNELLDKLFNLTVLHQDWSGLVDKHQHNLNTKFLAVLSQNFKQWINNLTGCFPNVIKLIESSAKLTEKDLIVA